MRYLKLLILALLFSGFATNVSFAQPKRVILFTIDGLHSDAPEKLSMPTLNSLKKEGTYIKHSYMILPHHPTVGEYGKLMTTSFPNPVLHQGTLFLESKGKFVQQMWDKEGEATAFITNSFAYTSVAKGFTDVVEDDKLSDDAAVERAMTMMEQKDYGFMRIHLQTAGNEGRFLADADPAKPYFRNIYGKGSPYAAAVENGDKLLRKLVKFLKKEGKWDDTLLIITSDHGQSLSGWHPITDPNSWKTPLLFIGEGIAKGRELPYFEHTDIVPTICHIMGKDVPNKNGATGHFIPEIMASSSAESFKPTYYIKKINEQIVEYNMIKSELFFRSVKEPYYANLITLMENSIMTPEPFYHQDRFTEWYMAGTLKHLIEVNESLIKDIRSRLK